MKHTLYLSWARIAGFAGFLCAMQLQADTIDVVSLRTLFAKAENKDVEAQYQLGIRFDKGMGAPRNVTEALVWYKQAALSGHSEAQFALGQLYTTGSGLERDYVQAYSWLNIAAGYGHPKAGNRRDILALWMTSENIRKAEELALNIFFNQNDLVKDYPTSPPPTLPKPPKIPTKPTKPTPPKTATPTPAPLPPLP